MPKPKRRPNSASRRSGLVGDARPDSWLDDTTPDDEAAASFAAALDAVHGESPEKRKQWAADLAAKARAAGLRPIIAAEDVVRRPRASCDVCGTVRASFQCARCGSAHYCSAQCQKDAWRGRAGSVKHKDECDGLKAQCEASAAAVVAQVNDEELSVVGRVQDLGELGLAPSPPPRRPPR